MATPYGPSGLEQFATTSLQFISSALREKRGTTLDDVSACLVLVRASLVTLLRELQRQAETSSSPDPFKPINS